MLKAQSTPHDNEDRSDSDGQTLTATRPRLAEPSMYRVVLLNDDYTPMDFVILILRKFFYKTDAEASQIMLQVHNQGSGLAGVFSFEVAETKVYLVTEFSQRHKHPLRCIMEKER